MRSPIMFALLCAVMIIAISSCKKNEATDFSQVSPPNNGVDILPSQTFTCTQVAGATSYIFHFTQGTDTFSQTSFTTSIMLTNLKPCATYTWAVVAYKSDGSTVTTSVWGFRISGSGTVSCLLTPIDQTSNLCLTPDLKWTSLSGISSYRLEVADNMYFSNPAIAQAVSTTFFTIPAGKLAADKTYYWRVAASGAAYSSIYSFSTVPHPSCSAPADGSTAFSRTPTFTWTGSSCADSYLLEVSDISNFGNRIYSAQVSGTSHSLPAASTLSAFTTYYWRVSVTNYTSVSASNSFSTGL